MNDSANDTTSRKRPGGQPGNTNGQRHGLFSTRTPPTVADLRALADTAIEEQDVPLLARIERAAKFHAAHAPLPGEATRYRQAERMIRAARAMLAYDQRKEEQTHPAAPFERSDHAVQGGGEDDWPAPEPFASGGPEGIERGQDDTLPESDFYDWLTTYHPIHDQPPLPDILDPPPTQPSIFGSRAARGSAGAQWAARSPGGQDEFPGRTERPRRRY